MALKMPKAAGRESCGVLPPKHGSKTNRTSKLAKKNYCLVGKYIAQVHNDCQFSALSLNAV